MTTEVSQYDIKRLESAHKYLEKEVRRLADELRAVDLRHFRDRLEIEPRLMNWVTILFCFSLAFSLFIAICAKHPIPASSETAIEASAKTN